MDSPAVGQMVSFVPMTVLNIAAYSPRCAKQLGGALPYLTERMATCASLEETGTHLAALCLLLA